ncbi:MAG: phage virion morphogenesis protein [Comamonadaceae bacterium]|nr:phage virion morphogenesis protein [Comamonadaceae bacterium]
MITIQVNHRQVLTCPGELARKRSNFKPVMKEIGEDLVCSTKARFASATGPDGVKWKANSQVTIDRFWACTLRITAKTAATSPIGTSRKTVA